MTDFCLFNSKENIPIYPRAMDPVINSDKVDILAGKPGGLFAVWDHILPRHYRKRLVPGCSHVAEHQKHNYLHSWFPPGRSASLVWSQDSGLDKTRFHRGFKRRLLPESHQMRDDIANRAFAKYNSQTAARVAELHAHPRNVITSVGVPSGPRLGRRVNLDIQFEEDRRRLSRKRVSESNARFHTEGGLTRVLTAPVYHPCESLLVTKSLSKQNRVQSVGILDNFRHTQIPLNTHLSKQFSIRNNSQIVF